MAHSRWNGSVVNREQLAHVLRAAAQIAGDPEIIVIGSQAILGSFTEEELPPQAVFSMEADLAFLRDPEERKSDLVDGAIGENSEFHHANAVYGQGVSITTATLPRGWEARVVPYERDDAAPSRAVCIDRHDLVISKLVAGRDKDYEFASALIAAQLVDVETLQERAVDLPVPGAVVRRVQASILRCARRSVSRSPDQ